jgi:hypothetical protein
MEKNYKEMREEGSIYTLCGSGGLHLSNFSTTHTFGMAQIPYFKLNCSRIVKANGFPTFVAM